MPRHCQRKPFQIDHILPTVHGGRTTLANLAYSCINCNVHKGINLAGIDPKTRTVVSLFHPRKDSWIDHFDYRRARLIGKSATGRATILVLKINALTRIQVRRSHIEIGVSFDG
jgi:hypothetical protein